VWFLLGYAFFSAMAAASRALVSRQEEINGVMMPVTLLTMTAYVVGLLAIINPGAALAHVLSIVPPFSAIVMPVRIASSAVPAWEIVTAVVLMAAAAVAMVALGARIYERAVLRTGARVRLREVVAARGRGRPYLRPELASARPRPRPRPRRRSHRPQRPATGLAAQRVDVQATVEMVALVLQCPGQQPRPGDQHRLAALVDPAHRGVRGAHGGEPQPG
jgi:hypothetical protein